jgi:SAM-dependent methyltransferase
MTPVSHSLAAPARAPEPALSAYESCARYYDLLTADYDHEGWLATIDALAVRHGFRGRRVLDVACGTGKSTAPLIRCGYEVSACDLSPAMVRRARMRLGDRAEVFVADMRRLPAGRTFELLTCLDDALNYLLGDEDLRAAMRSFASVLAPRGLAIFDLNTTATYRTVFEDGCAFPAAGGRLRWRGQGRRDDGAYSAVVEPIAASGRAGRPSLHIQRHHPPEAVRRACGAAGLEVLWIYGQSSGGVLHEACDEDQQTKLLYVARKRGGRGAS